MLSGLLASFVGSHIAGMAAGGILSKYELFGFGVKAARAARANRVKRLEEKARRERELMRSEHLGWMQEAVDSEPIPEPVKKSIP